LATNEVQDSDVEVALPNYYDYYYYCHYYRNEQVFLLQVLNTLSASTTLVRIDPR
jgi:hypothetical protein